MEVFLLIWRFIEETHFFHHPEKYQQAFVDPVQPDIWLKKIRRLADINLKLKIFIDIYRRDTEIKEEQKNRYVTRSKWEYRYFSYHSLYVYQTKTNNCSDIKKLWLLC